MRNIRTHRSRPFSKNHRKGTAPIELTLFLPIYAAILMVLFTIFSFARTRGEVAVETRHEAWINRSRSGKETASLAVSQGDVEKVGRILNKKQDPMLGLVSATRQKNATIYLKTLKLFTNIQLSHAVMTDTWDYKTMPFEEQNGHPRLTLSERTVVFGSIDRGVFGSLASSTSAFAGKAGSLQQSLDQERNQAMSRLNQARSKVSREISATESRLKSLNAKLKQKLEIVPLDELAILELKNQISAASKELEELNDHLRKLDSATGYLDGELTGSVSAGEFNVAE